MKIKRVRHAVTGELYGYRFWCPGCQESHIIGASWQFNGDMERPTFSPSIKVTMNSDPSYCCHSFITDGKLQFQTDCSHALAGSTGPLPEWPEDSADNLQEPKTTP